MGIRDREYLLQMKDQGVVRHIGLSTHAPELANLVLDMGILDMLMFSINPMYDYGQGAFAIGSGSERQRLYRRCEQMCIRDRHESGTCAVSEQ